MLKRVSMLICDWFVPTKHCHAVPRRDEKPAWPNAVRQGRANRFCLEAKVIDGQQLTTLLWRNIYFDPTATRKFVESERGDFTRWIGQPDDSQLSLRAGR